MSTRYDGRVQDIQGNALQGASIAVLTQPAVTTTQPGSPLASIFTAAVSNANSITAAVWSNLTQQITFTFGSTPSSDVVAGSYFSVTGATPAAYNGFWQVVSVSGLNVVVTTPFTLAPISNPGTFLGGGITASSALPNPFFSDQLGNFFFYVTPGVYTVQIYDTVGRIQTQLVLADQTIVAGGAGSGTVTSIALSMPPEFSVSGSPITAAGTLTVGKLTEPANQVYAGPSSGAPGAPAFRSLVPADFPAGVGTVTSVGHTLTVPASIMGAVTVGQPVTTTGVIADTISLVNQNANTVWAGPSSGAAAAPAFRSLVAQDLPFTTTSLTSVQLLALQTTSVVLVPAPGVGFVIVPTMIVIKFYGGGAAYTDAGGAVQFTNSGVVAALASNALFLVTTSPNRRIQYFPWPGGTSTAGNPPPEDNQPLLINKVTNNFAAGTGTATIFTWYYVVPTT
jgi:hypothetical protein